MKNLDIIIKRNLLEIENSVVKNKDLFLEVDLSSNSSGKRKYRCVDDGRRCFFKFSEFGEVMFVPQYTTLYYLTRYPKTSEILNMDRTNIGKDKYGYYETIFVPAYGENVNRYFPIENWNGWNFIKDQDIPFAIETRDGPNKNLYTLTLALYDPINSVIGIRDPNKKDPNLPKGAPIPGGKELDQNPSRGWIISGGGKLTNQPTDAGTGYYKLDNGQFVAYNVIGPENRYDEQTWVGSDSSEAVRFWDSGTGILVQIGLSIVVTVVLRMPIAVSLGASLEITAASTAALRARLIVATIITESLVNLPIAMVYFNNPGDEYDSAGWISILFCLLPLAQGSLMKSVIGDFSNATAWSLAQKIVQRRLGKAATQAEVELFFRGCTMEERYLAMRVLKSVSKEGGQEALEKLLKTTGGDELEKLLRKNYGKISKSPYYIKAATFIEEQLKNQPGFWKSIGIDFASTFMFGKAMGKIMDSYGKSKEKKGESLKLLSEEEKNKLKQKVAELSKQFEGLPKYIQSEINDKKIDENAFQFILTEDQKIWMLENGKLGPKIEAALSNYVIKKHSIKSCEEVWESDGKGGYIMNEDGRRQINGMNVDLDWVQSMYSEIVLKNKFDQLDEESKRIVNLLIKCLPEGGYSTEFLGTGKKIQKQKNEVKPQETQSTETQKMAEPPKWQKVSESEFMERVLMVDQNGNSLYDTFSRTSDDGSLEYYIKSKLDLTKKVEPNPISKQIDSLTDPNLAPVNSTNLNPQSIANDEIMNSKNVRPTGPRIKTN